MVQKSQSEIAQWLVSLLSQILEKNPTDIEQNVRFDRYGIDSVAALSIVDELGKFLKKDLDATMVYDYPTIDTLSEYVAQLLEKK